MLFHTVLTCKHITEDKWLSIAGSVSACRVTNINIFQYVAKPLNLSKFPTRWWEKKHLCYRLGSGLRNVMWLAQGYITNDWWSWNLSSYLPQYKDNTLTTFHISIWNSIIIQVFYTAVSPKYPFLKVEILPFKKDVHASRLHRGVCGRHPIAWLLLLICYFRAQSALKWMKGNQNAFRWESRK